jgi:alpha/beta hydrolase fold
MTTLSDTPAWQSVKSRHSWRYYLQGIAEPGSINVPTYAAPARATVEDLSGLPPAFVIAYQIDPTRDEGLDYAHRVIPAGVPTAVHHYPGAFHMAHIIPGTVVGAPIIAGRKCCGCENRFNREKAVTYPGSTGATPGIVNPDTSDQPCWLSGADAEYCRTPCGAATYTADGLAATVVTGICTPRAGASEFTPSRLT